jgi:hypothetical protein
MDHNGEEEEDIDDGVMDIQQQLQLLPTDGMQQQQREDGEEAHEDDNKDVAVDNEGLFLLMRVIQLMDVQYYQVRQGLWGIRRL